VRRGGLFGVDGALLALVFVCSAIWGGAAYTRVVRNGGHPFFYQYYFEPAVMTACGRGFLVAPPGRRPPALEAFLLQQADRFSCSDLPSDLHVGTEGLYQRPWRYLMTAVGVAWMVLGISWSGLSPLFGIFFGATTALVYALCRLVAGRVASLMCAAALCLSPLQIANLPNLRDYAKAPFTLGLVLILAALVLRPWRSRDVLALSLCYGLVMGFGLGFRGDLLIDIPPFLIAVALFLPGGLLHNVPLKIAAVMLAAAGFVATGWPIIQATVVATGGCQAHVFLLGLASPFNDALGVKGGSYGWGHLYNDEYIWATVSNYATRFRPDLGYIEYCSHEYDTASGEYARHILKMFPADIVTRAYASVLHVLDLPFERFHVLRYAGSLMAAAFVVAISWSSVRLALFAVFMAAYFGGHPAIQFQPRHYFPFEFMTWVVAAFLFERGVRWSLSGAFERSAWVPQRTARLQSAVVLAIVTTTVVAPLAILRRYQNGRASALLESYVAAPASPLPLHLVAPGQLRLPVDPSALPPRAVDVIAALGRAKARFVEAVLDAAACRPGTTLTFRYDPAYPAVDFSRTVELPAVPPSAGLTRLFEPVYATFTGIDISDPSPACQPMVAVMDSADQFRLLLSAQLPPGWESQSQNQQIVYSR
jgi:hypothetical protein